MRLSVSAALPPATPRRRARLVQRLPSSTNRWVAAAALVIALGATGSVLAAHTVADTDAQTARRASAAAAADVASTLRMAIEHQNDLVVSASAFWGGNSAMSNRAFNEWVRADRVVERYPELLGLGTVVIVPRSQLTAFARASGRTASTRPGSAQPFTVMPPGVRSFYCFAGVGAAALTGGVQTPLGQDFCAGGTGPLLLAARDSGRNTYFPVQIGTTQMLGIQAPTYRGGTIPATVAARRAAFVGWVGMVLLPNVVLRQALTLHPGMAATFRFTQGVVPISFSAGVAPHSARTLTTDLHNGWKVETSAPAIATGIFADRNALGVLGSGIGLSLLLGLLVSVLATGRARAFRLVTRQTVELRDQADRLRSTIGELEAAQAIRDEFLALVSHELRTPLTSIRGYSELLAEEGLTSEQEEFLAVIARSAERLQHLVEDLLLMTQIQSGGLPLDQEDVVLGDLISRSAEAAKPFAESKSIALRVDLESGLATEGDPVRLSQAIDNLVSNAIKYTPAGGNVAITMTRDGETATIEVSDTGIGIPEEEQPQVFGRFFRSSNARGSGVGGTGLGLAITRGIVEAHGGTIGFESSEGAGTTFRITLPHVRYARLASAA